MASKHNKKVPLTLSERYLEQILVNLRRAGVVQSQRGSKGGVANYLTGNFHSGRR
jgi:hypothetical protein